MKSLDLTLKERLLIVEVEPLELAKTMLSGCFFQDKELEMLCLGSELTEEIAEEFSKPVKSSHGEDGFINYLYEAKEIVYSPAFVTALESFISAVEAAGYHWGENPLEKEVDSLVSDNSANGCAKYRKAFHEWKEAESRTFNPEKTLIFKII